MADSYKNIKRYATNFEIALNSLQSGITVVNPADEVFSVLMEVENVQSIIDLPGCKFVAGIVGIHYDNGTPRLTVSLLGADSNEKILAAHRTGTEPGQEVWPKRRTLKDKSTFLP
jgi:hypothetical protein